MRQTHRREVSRSTTNKQKSAGPPALRALSKSLFRERRSTRHEADWFARASDIPSYASSDGYIVFNPHLKLTKRVRRSLYLNEYTRLLFRKLALTPDITLRESQVRRFQHTPYAKNKKALRETIIARLVANDPSAGNATEFQRGYARCMQQLLAKLLSY